MTDFTLGILRRDDFVLLTDDIKCWIVEIEDISLLEARQNFTLAHFAGGKLLIRRSLRALRAQATHDILGESQFWGPRFVRPKSDFAMKRSTRRRRSAMTFMTWMAKTGVS